MTTQKFRTISSSIKLTTAIICIFLFSVFISKLSKSHETLPLSDDEVLSYFSGTYSRIRGIASDTFVITPKNTFSLGIHSDILLGNSNSSTGITGNITVSNGIIKLISEDDIFHLFIDSEYLIPIRWGSRKFLVENIELLDFCKRISNGEEPRPSGLSYYFYNMKHDPEPKNAPILPNGNLACP